MVIGSKNFTFCSFPSQISEKHSVMTIFILVILSILGPSLVLVGLKPCIASLWALYGWSIGFVVGGTTLVMVVVNKWNHLAG